MTERPNVPERTRQLQALAARPDASAWVSANAGSGKTYVLVNRVLRLLLDGVPPGRILCITYTRAAAANMANRVFAELSAWATLPEARLAEAIARLTGEAPDATTLGRARRLFAQALETPGGLKIETIHAFCTRVLQSAPFEANVPPGFRVADERDTQELARESRRAVLTEAARDPGGDLARALGVLVAEADQDAFDQIMRAAGGKAAIFLAADGAPRAPAATEAAISDFLGIAENLDAAGVRGSFGASLAAVPDLAALIEAFEAGGQTRRGAASALRQALRCRDGEDPLGHCRGGLLTLEGTVNSNVSGRGKSALPPALQACLDAVAGPLIEGLDQLRAIGTRERSLALATVVGATLAAQRALKSKRSLLDFDDLIQKTRSLLERIDARWVLYKLDAGLDHILIDEAQDTSEPQWAILGRLADEFGAGERAGSSGGKPRTIFAVGDEKQSIYGFQGAAPRAFAAQRAALGHKLVEAGGGFESVALTTSFRSAPAIVQAVDAVFGVPEHWAGLVHEPGVGPERHDTVWPERSGAVDLWPLFADTAGHDLDAWQNPLNSAERKPAQLKLAERLAAVLARWTKAGRDDRGGAFSPGDVMILLPRRGALFETIIKQLKDRGVPVAGRDRLVLARHPAVEDMIALGRALLLPDDDLMLATALKTPVFGLSDDDLITFAPGRPGSLRAALHAAGRADPRLAEAERLFEALAAEQRACGPFRFHARLLGPGGARNAALARLGPESGDALDAFLAAALEFERREGPSQAGFLRRIAEASTDVKRDLSAGAGEVRVMTVHGAKGLEARIVILPDIAPAPGAGRLPKILRMTTPVGTPVPIWSPRKEGDPAAVKAGKAAILEGETEEHHRLLYVALTRAEDRLIVCGAQKDGVAPEGSWYAMVAAGLATLPTEEVAAPFGEGTIRRFVPVPPREQADAPTAAPVPALAIPAWLLTAAPPEPDAAPPLRPSSAARAADRPDRPGDGPFRSEAAAAGRFAHLLLQVLPDLAPERRKEAALALAEAKAGTLPAARREALVGEVLALLAAPDLAPLFGPGSLAEVPVAGVVRLADGVARPVSGQIDRLALVGDAVWVVDFKTAARPPALPDALPAATLTQLAIYRALAAAAFPGRAVRVIALYTATLARFEPDDATLDAALRALAAA